MSFNYYLINWFPFSWRVEPSLQGEEGLNFVCSQTRITRKRELEKICTHTHDYETHHLADVLRTCVYPCTPHSDRCQMGTSPRIGMLNRKRTGLREMNARLSIKSQFCPGVNQRCVAWVLFGFYTRRGNAFMKNVSTVSSLHWGYFVGRERQIWI